MAIKGKARSRGGKAVSRGPKPVYVPVKTPLIRRRGLWIALAVIVGVGSVAGIGYGLAKERTNQREKDLSQHLATQMSVYQAKVDPLLAGVGTQAPPQPFQALPELGTALDDLGGKSPNAKADAASAKSAGGKAKEAADGFEQVQVTSIVGGKGFDESFVNYAINSKARMTEGLRLYQQVAAMIEQGVQLSGDQRTTLLATAKAVLDQANTIFGEGYNDYIQAQTIAGTFTPTIPGSTGGLTP